MHQKLKNIRLKLGYSIRGFAELLGLHPATYQGYESNSRKIPDAVMTEANNAFKRDRNFFTKELPVRISQVKLFMSERV